MKFYHVRVAALFVAGAYACISPASAAEPSWKAAAAKVAITPEAPMWMSGYSARDHAAEGKLTDLWVKALVLEDPRGQRAALVTFDLVGIDRDTSNEIRDELENRYKLSRKQVALCCSHTHTGPVVGRNLRAMYFLDAAQSKLVDAYTTRLIGKATKVVGEAIDKLQPCRIAWANGHATFAVNRRTNVEANVPRLREQGELKGPVDYDVPVLAVRDTSGKLVAAAFGYACHATVLSFYQWSGDYPGFAQKYLEERHPGATALFFAGCGADQNPLPRREVSLADRYGRRLADAVDDVLSGVMQAVSGELAMKYEEIPLPFATLPTREELQSQAKPRNKYEAVRAKTLLAQLDAGKPLSPTYPYPVQSWRLGPGLSWITLGGEVVVDYSLRLKQELGRQRTWVSSYTNDVMAYIPSRRVLAEGGYEGGGAMVYYGLPTVWSPEVEETIVRAVRKQAK
jgi:Neutral/alkaline non-lysosomal ceramidase, N-terminal